MAFTRLRKKKAKEYERVQARLLKKSKKKDEKGDQGISHDLGKEKVGGVAVSLLPGELLLMRVSDRRRCQGRVWPEK